MSFRDWLAVKRAMVRRERAVQDYAGLDHRRELPRWGQRLNQRVGRWLVALGGHVVRIGLPPYRSVGGEVTRRR
jgi:phosphohistidine phosphatase SixA